MKLFLLIVTLCSLNLCKAQTLTFNNLDFLQAVLKKYPDLDLNKDGKIQRDEADKVKELDLTDQNLKDAQDVNKFKNIEELSLSLNQIEKIKLDGLKYLTRLYCARNNLKELQISNMPMLSDISCGANQLTQVTIQNCPSITSINVMDNQIIDIDVTTFKKLKVFVADNNKLEKLDLSKNTELIQIIVYNNFIKSIDITNNQKLKMDILYIDKSVNIIGTKEQISKYRMRETLETLEK